LSDKKEKNYKDLLAHLEISPNEFLMIGNSLKSDVLPLVNIGASAVHVPFHTTWKHEEVHAPEKKSGYITVQKLTDVLAYL
jgi:putative hydrolase of the HAD superfamily